MSKFASLGISKNEFEDIIKKANEIHIKNQPKQVTFNKCLFLSYYCSLGDCDFCFRSVIKKNNDSPEKMRRSVSSLLAEAVLVKKFGWKIEFLTGGYGIFTYDEMVEVARLISIIYEDKLMINLGAMGKKHLEKFKPYCDGIICSVETMNSKLRNKVCPSKPLSAYETTYNFAEGFKKGITIVLGIGETKEDIQLLFDFVDKYKLDQVTFYALNPVYGTPYKEGPESEYYAWWIATTRIKYPKMHLVAGTGNDRSAETELLCKAGANAITKFSAIRLFGTDAAKNISKGVENAGRTFIGTMDKVPDIDWNDYVDKLDFKLKPEDEMNVKEKLKIKLQEYLNRLNKRKIQVVAWK